ncbi:hypothetical protein ACFO3U_04235 [Flavobacterium ponti]|uniref:DUF4369 domain-containing protein n=1 Tax=Flavobacterium ponti TaxID=665133 RepID=A0ABV9P0P3_9FLAO
MIKTKFTIFFLVLFYLGFSQDQEATIFFKDGDSLQGFAMIKNEKIKFRLSLEDKPDTWDEESVSKVEFYGFNIIKTYVYMKPNKYEKMRLFELLVDGEVSLYLEGFSHFVTTSPNNPGSSQIVDKIYNYVKRKTDEFPTCINCYPLESWKKKTLVFFKDCPNLIKKIKNNELREIHLVDIVYFYNDYCTDEEEILED